MDQAEAYRVLSGPVRFGDADALEARDYIRHLTGVRERMMRCQRCEGTGVREDSRGRGRRYCVCIALESDELRRDLGVSLDRESE